MKTPLRVLLALAALAALVSAPSAGPDTQVVDTGRLIVLDRGTPVGYEDFEYDRQGDSLLLTASHTRGVRAADGKTSRWLKKFGLVADGRDFGLRSYTSNLEFEGHTTVRGVIPGDTSMTVYTEIDGQGDAMRLAQPPGRMFVMDPFMFTLFDLVLRSVSAQSLAKRPVELVTLGPTPEPVRATATAAGPDTIQWGGRRMIARRYVIDDGQSTFLAWVSPQGQMLRLVHQGGTLEVLREEPKPAPAAKPKR